MATKAEGGKINSILRLVVDGGSRIDGKHEDKDEFSFENEQFEMFGKPDSIMYAAARELDLKDIKTLILSYHVHHILDLREVPYLNFGRSKRDSFFQYIYNHSVEYLSMISIASQKNKSSIDDLFEDDSCLESVSDELVHWIEKGPTLVLINQLREKDPLAKRFNNFLKKSNVKFSEIPN